MRVLRGGGVCGDGAACPLQLAVKVVVYFSARLGPLGTATRVHNNRCVVSLFGSWHMLKLLPCGETNPNWH